jgi:3'(2'), 5'-bisphosphate nucleotidase
LLDCLTTAASQAGAAILAVRSPTIEWTSKADKSPVTAADRASQEIILRTLHQFLPGVPVVSEEAELPEQLDAARFVLIDPLDGTKEFIAGSDDFTVNIALIDNAVPVLGIVGAPAQGLIWRGAVGFGAERLALAPGKAAERASRKEAVRTRRPPADGLTAVVSHSHLDPSTLDFLSRLPVAQRIAVGSSLKLARIAEGSADIYPRLAPTSEWDIAAGHALVTAAGGCVMRPDGTALTYGHRERAFLVPGFIAWADPQAARPA